MAAKRKRKSRAIDWSTCPAPPKGSPLRKRYEKSAVFRKRQQAALKAAATRKRQAEAVARKRERTRRLRIAKKELRPLLKRMMQKVERGRPTAEVREAHVRWYEKKELFAMTMGRSEYEAVLEALALDLDTDEFGWNIVY